VKSTLLFLYAEAPLHAGSGVGLGAVDLPIQRERMSGLPMVQGSGIKGALRERMRPPLLDESTFLTMFGPWAPKPRGAAIEQDARGEGGQGDTGGASESRPDEFAGALSVMDARVLLFPVRTAFGGFAWLTCPLILDRLRRDLALLGVEGPSVRGLQPAEGQALVTKGSSVVTKSSSVPRDDRLVIEDLEYGAKADDAADPLAGWLAANALPEGKEYDPFRERLKKQLAVVDDTEFAFLSNHATEVVARTRIDDQTGTVSRGALWTEESLPAETLLWTTLTFANGRNPRLKQQLGADQSLERFAEACDPARAAAGVQPLTRIYLGGDRTVGRGLVGLRLMAAQQQGGAK
jgi:CRISPR-associated protein Cmr4